MLTLFKTYAKGDLQKSIHRLAKLLVS